MDVSYATNFFIIPQPVMFLFMVYEFSIEATWNLFIYNHLEQSLNPMIS